MSSITKRQTNHYYTLIYSHKDSEASAALIYKLIVIAASKNIGPTESLDLKMHRDVSRLTVLPDSGSYRPSAGSDTVMIKVTLLITKTVCINVASF